MRSWRFNTIATRLAVTIILAIILGVALEVVTGFSIAYFASRPGTRVILSRSGGFIFNSRRQPIFIFATGTNPTLLASRIAAVAKLLASAPESDVENIVATASRPDLQLALARAPLRVPDDRSTDRLDVLRRLIEFELNAPDRSVIVTTDRAAYSGGGDNAPSGPETSLLVETALPGGQWLMITIPDYATTGVSVLRLILVVSPLFMLIGLLSVLAARRLAAPIRNFAAAAERLGVDSSAPSLPELGPHELRIATRAFNRMQERLRRFVEDRTQMLAVMSHDLRTPLNRLRLRAEFIDDEDQQQKMFADLEAMNTMIDATLAFARDDVKREPRRLVDLGVLIEDICEDAVDAGASVTYSGPRGINVRCRPTAVSRIVANLIDNAVKYGGVARVDLARRTECVVVTIDDDGPGIPADEQEKVFAPFYQLDRARNPDSGGVGLGLSVARTIAREHGGDVILANRTGGGFRARVELPTEQKL
jgi:signal transduction histidine kinase